MSQTLDIAISILLGLGLSAVFKVCCDSRNCMVYRAPDIHQTLLRYDNKCYQPTERSETCDATKTRVQVNE